MKIKFILVAGLLMPFGSINLQAQDNGKTQGGYNENVVVTAPYQPVLGAVEKPVSVPHTADTTVVIPPSDIQIISRPFATSYPTENIKPAKVLGEPIPKLFNNTVKVGGGNRGLGVEADFAVGRNRQYEVAAGYRHHSTYGKIKDYDRFKTNYSLNEANVVGRLFGEKFITALEIFYSQRAVNCYGVNNSIDTNMLNLVDLGDFKKQSKRWFQNARGRLTFTDNAKSFDALRFDATADYNLNLTNWRSIENTAIVEGGVSKVVVQQRRSADMFSIGARFRFEDNMYRDGINDGHRYGMENEKFHKGNELRNAYHFNIQPQIRFKYEFVELNADMVFHIYGHGGGDGVAKEAKFQFNPVVDLKLHIIPRAFTFFIGTGGGVERNTVDRISRTNPFLHPLLYPDLKFTRDKFSAYAGLSGNFSRNIDYRVQVSAHFMQDVLSFDYYRYDYSHYFNYYGYNDFRPLYSGSVFNLRVRGDLNFCWTDKIIAHVDAEYSHYGKRLYYMPEFTANLDFRYNVVNRIWVYTDIKGYTNMKARDRAGRDVILKGCFDWSIGAEYRFIKRMTAFVELNNLIAQRYYRWYDVPSYRFNFMAGLSVDF
ncbi:MAG: TonB-dependent receptor [Lentimicrobiaceae bacterium]|nr:TonB-dependent receptor [Lentimicrobiaceae bacterium]